MPQPRQKRAAGRREAARQFGIGPRTVAKMLAFSVPPGYRRRRPPGTSEARPVHRDHRRTGKQTRDTAELGDQIVRILERRLATMRAELQKLGAEHQGESR